MRVTSGWPRSCPVDGRPTTDAEPYLTVAAGECRGGSGRWRQRREGSRIVRRRSRMPAAAGLGNPEGVAEGRRTSGWVVGPNPIESRSVRRTGCAWFRGEPSGRRAAPVSHPGRRPGHHFGGSAAGRPRMAAAHWGEAQRRRRAGPGSEVGQESGKLPNSLGRPAGAGASAGTSRSIRSNSPML